MMNSATNNRTRGHRPTRSTTIAAAAFLSAILFAISSLYVGTRLLLKNDAMVDSRRMMELHNVPRKNLKTTNSYKTSPPPLPPNKQFTTHFCHSRDYVDGNAQRASCLFHNVCIVQRPPNSNSRGNNNRHEIEFLYVYDNGSGNGHKIKERIKNGDASFTLGVGPHSGDERVIFKPVPVTMDKMNNRYPKREYVTGTSVLFYEYNAENFGHVLTDVLLPIYVALQGFGLENYRDIKLFRYSIMDAIGWSCDFHRRIPEEEGSYGNVGKHCDRFYKMIPEFMPSERRPLQVLNGTTVQPTCFQNLVVGMPMYSDDCDEGFERETDIWSLCNHARQGQFWQFRNYLLQNVLGSSYDEGDVPVHHKITITQRSDGLRALANLDQLIGKLREKYEGVDGSKVEVVVVQWEKLSLKDQLDLARSTTVHLTPPGGVSFIALFLPRWSTSIRLYSDEYMMEWNIMNYLGYIALEYVDCRDDSLIPLNEVLGFVEEGLKRYDEYRAGDASWTPYNDGSSTSHTLAELPSSDLEPISIPKIVYQSWISRKMAPKMKANLKKWSSMNRKSYRFVFFDDKEQRDWMMENCNEYWPAWNAMELPVARADLFRYCLLYVNGGVWSDVDMSPLRPLSDFIDPSAELIVVHDGGMPGDEFLYNAFMAAVPRHPVLKRAMDIVKEHYKLRLEEGAVICTGPHVLWRALNDTISGQVPPKTFVGFDKKRRIEYLSFTGEEIVNTKHELMNAKYDGYLDDATLHGGEPHYGREVTWSTSVEEDQEYL